MGEKERKGVKRKKDGPSLKRLQLYWHVLGWQWVVIAFAALALAAQDDGSGQEEEGGGNQQEKAESGKDPNNLQWGK